VRGIPARAHEPKRKKETVPNITPVAWVVVGFSGSTRGISGRGGRLQAFEPFHIMIPKGFKTLPLPISQLSLAAVLKCGQSFRWVAYPLAVAGEIKAEDEKPTHEYRFALQDRVICLRQDSDSLFYRSLFPEGKIDASEDSDITKDEETLDWLKDYFQLDVDLVKLYTEWAERDIVFRDTVKDRFAGIRMLRQDPWENVIS
jgi:N-glycosylase/DNA lyase